MTILRRAAPTRWLYPAILLLLFMEKSSAVEIAGYGGSASWTQIGATFESDGSDSPGSILSFSQDGSRLLSRLELRFRRRVRMAIRFEHLDTDR